VKPFKDRKVTLPNAVGELAPARAALRQTEMITAVGIILGALEHLVSPEQFEEQGLISWEVGRTRFKSLAHPRADLLGKVMAPPGLQVVVALRVAAAAVVMSGNADRRSKAAAMAYLATTNWLLHVRNPLGGDGTDHMNMLVCATLTVSSLFPEDERIQEACTWFIAAQSTLSYAAAGAAKLVSPYWRNGTAMTGIFRTRSYGDERVHRLFTKYPELAKIGGWATMWVRWLSPWSLWRPRRLRWDCSAPESPSTSATQCSWA